MLGWNKTNGLNVAPQPIFTSFFLQSRDNRFFRRVILAAIFSSTSCHVVLSSSLSYTRMLYVTRTSMTGFSILRLCYRYTHIQASCSLLLRRDGRPERTAKFVLETAFPRCTFPQRRREKSACAHVGYAAPMLKAQLQGRKEATVYGFLYVFEFGVCLPALQA